MSAYSINTLQTSAVFFFFLHLAIFLLFLVPFVDRNHLLLICCILAADWRQQKKIELSAPQYLFIDCIVKAKFSNVMGFFVRGVLAGVPNNNC